MLHASNSGILQPSTPAFKIGTAPNGKQSSGPLALAEKIREPIAFVLQPPEEQDDNWDDDFEEGISFTKLQGILHLCFQRISLLIRIPTRSAREDSCRGGKARSRGSWQDDSAY
jgi:hypothetical protein